MSADNKFYSTLSALPRCAVGTRVYRKNLIGQYEEAMIVSVLSSSAESEDWQGTLMTKNGIEFISGHVEHRTVYDWMPVGWVYDEDRVGWVPPKTILRDDSKDAVMEDPEKAEKAAAASVYVIPAPWENEKYMSWKSRVLKSVPAIKHVEELKTKLSSSWKNKEYEITV
tara:strand:+ start:965 stop:1471 length:507 start_codon:yes stop_codon:yes gene_type:complete